MNELTPVSHPKLKAAASLTAFMLVTCTVTTVMYVLGYKAGEALANKFGWNDTDETPIV